MTRRFSRRGALPNRRVPCGSKEPLGARRRWRTTSPPNGSHLQTWSINGHLLVESESIFVWHEDSGKGPLRIPDPYPRRKRFGQDQRVSGQQGVCRLTLQVTLKGFCYMFLFYIVQSFFGHTFSLPLAFSGFHGRSCCYRPLSPLRDRVRADRTACGARSAVFRHNLQTAVHRRHEAAKEDFWRRKGSTSGREVLVETAAQRVGRSRVGGDAFAFFRFFGGFSARTGVATVLLLFLWPLWPHRWRSNRRSTKRLDSTSHRWMPLVRFFLGPPGRQGVDRQTLQPEAWSVFSFSSDHQRPGGVEQRASKERG